MTKYLTSFLFLIGNVSASSLGIWNLNLDYSAPRGRALMERAHIPIPPVLISSNDIEIDLFQENQNLKLMTSEIDFSFPLPFNLGQKEIMLRSFNLQNEKNGPLIKSRTIKLKEDKSQTTLTDTSLKCFGKKPIQTYEVKPILDYCINDSSFLIDHIDLGESDLVINLDNQMISFNKIKEAQMTFTEKLYELKFKVKKVLWVEVKVVGGAYINHEKNFMLLRISKAKIGFISIKNQLLKALEKLKMKGITLRGDSLIIKL